MLISGCSLDMKRQHLKQLTGIKLKTGKQLQLCVWLNSQDVSELWSGHTVHTNQTTHTHSFPLEEQTLTLFIALCLISCGFKLFLLGPAFQSNSSLCSYHVHLVTALLPTCTYWAGGDFPLQEAVTSPPQPSVWFIPQSPVWKEQHVNSIK